MPSLFGNLPAPLQARAGVARAGATRADFFYPNVIFKIGGVDHGSAIAANQSFIEVSSIEITQRLNAAPSECRFTVLPGLTVSAGQIVIIALGCDQTSQRLFAGVITEVAQRQESSRCVQDVTAKDYIWFLDKRLVTAEYSGLTADAIARAVVADFTTGITANHVASGFAAIGSFQATNERPSALLTRLAKQATPPAFWDLDAALDLHFYTSELESNPPDLTTANFYVQDFEIAADLTQVRTRVIVEGQSIGVPSIAIPAGADEIPLADASMFSTSGGKARIGTQVISYTSRTNRGLATGVNRPGAKLTADAAAGATSLTLDNVDWSSGGVGRLWALLSGQVIRASGVGPPFQITLPATGYGSLQAPVSSGATLTALDAITGIPTSGAGSLKVDQPSGAQLVVRVEVDDSGAQTALAALEGGDGIHEHLVEAAELGLAAATTRANAELGGFGAAVSSITFTSRHKQMWAGRVLGVNLTTVPALVGSFRLHDVVISGFDQVLPRNTRTAFSWPLRRVTAAPVAVSDLIDLLGASEDAA